MKLSVSRSMGGISTVVLIAIGICIDRKDLSNTDVILLGICVLLHSIGITIGELVDLRRAQTAALIKPTNSEQ